MYRRSQAPEGSAARRRKWTISDEQTESGSAKELRSSQRETKTHRRSSPSPSWVLHQKRSRIRVSVAGPLATARSYFPVEADKGHSAALFNTNSLPLQLTLCRTFHHSTTSARSITLSGALQRRHPLITRAGFYARRDVNGTHCYGLPAS